jgi:polyisoprenoid-binding protein YceI
MTDPLPPLAQRDQAVAGTWRLDPARSKVEFHARNFYGLLTVHGQFESYDGTVDLGREPAVQLTIEAASLTTNNAKRDAHLRSPDFFDVDHHPQVRFVSTSATLQGETLKLHGRLHAAGKQVPIDLEATLRRVDDELEIETTTQVDQRQLGMTWSPLGMLRQPSTLSVHGRLIREPTTPS